MDKSPLLPRISVAAQWSSCLHSGGRDSCGKKRRGQTAGGPGERAGSPGSCSPPPSRGLYCAHPTWLCLTGRSDLPGYRFKGSSSGERFLTSCFSHGPRSAVHGFLVTSHRNLTLNSLSEKVESNAHRSRKSRGLASGVAGSRCQRPGVVSQTLNLGRCLCL